MEPGVVAHANNPSTEVAGAGAPPQVQGRPELYNELQAAWATEMLLENKLNFCALNGGAHL